jgi:transposase
MVSSWFKLETAGAWVMARGFWLDDRQWTVIEPLLPRNQPGAHRKDDRRIISGIIHVLKVGCRWQDCPAVYGPPTTIYNRFHRWARRGIWRHLFAALVAADPGGVQMIDSTTSKAHRSAGGGKGGPTSKRSAARAAGERQKSMLLSMAAAVPSRST